jgi:hypothetical protein
MVVLLLLLLRERPLVLPVLLVLSLRLKVLLEGIVFFWGVSVLGQLFSKEDRSDTCRSFGECQKVVVQEGGRGKVCVLACWDLLQVVL